MTEQLAVLISIWLAFSPQKQLPLVGVGSASAAGGTITQVCQVSATPGTGGGQTGSCNAVGATSCYAVITDGNAAAVYTASDTSSNTYTHAGTTNTVNALVDLWYVDSPTVTSTLKFTGSSSGNQPDIYFACYSGTKTSGSYDNTNSVCANAGTGTAGSPGSVTPSENNDLNITATSPRFGSSLTLSYQSYTVNMNFNSGGSNYAGAGAFQVQTTATATNPPWTWTNNENWGSCVWTFKHS